MKYKQQALLTPQHNILFTVEEVNLILGALSEMPYKVVNTLLLKVTKEANDQVNAQNIANAPKEQASIQ